MSIDLTAELMRDDFVIPEDQLDKALESSGDVMPGKYPARLDGAGQKDGRWEMWFVVTSGPKKGRKVKYTLWVSVGETDAEGNPRTAEEIAKMKQDAINEYSHTARVLGLMTRETVDGKAVRKYAPGKRDFRDVLNAECVIETKLRTYKKSDGTEGTSAEVKKFGVIAFGDPRAKGVERPAAGTLPPVAAQPSVAAQDLTDLV